jgi:Fe-S-cluster-containing hydrogenase component 2/CRP-like cAMP-binding protein
MARVVTNIPAEFEQVAAPLSSGDELLTAKELAVLSIFESLKKAPSFEKFPGSTLLRKCDPGRVLCEQGAAGATAFTILTTQDILKLRSLQLQAIREELAARAEKRKPDDPHPQFAQWTTAELQSREREFLAEIDRLTVRAAELERPENKDNSELRRRATAHLLVNLEGTRSSGSFWQRAARWLTGRRLSRQLPKWIAIDGADVNAQTKMAPLHEGDLFGEMSCINRAPRSATVVADHECYMLEMLRNVLDMLHSDPVYKQRMDAVYRQRVLEGHIRRLSIFEDLSDADFSRLRSVIELIEIPTGGVIFEQFDDSDSFYVIRSGLVKAVANAWTKVRAAEFAKPQWSALAAEVVAAASSGSRLTALVGNALSPALRDTAQRLASAADVREADRTALVLGLNEFICGGAVHLQLGKTTAEVAVTVNDAAMAQAMFDFPDDPKKWSELESRTFHRLLLEHVFSNMPRRAATAGPRRTLSYLGRGDYFGEIGVITGEPRSATLYAYDHPDGGANQRVPDSRTGAVPSRVELVKIPKPLFQELMASSPSLKAKVEAVIAKRQQRSKEQDVTSSEVFAFTRSQSPEFEQLGLIQGQQLMLIDLDRCTRCNQCVEACVSAHDDGRTRLYLDGPRFENFLVPISCRSCLDPVCMIGCPVGSINRGERGEIVIENWCIGCGLCADQCPYGSILMNPLTQPVSLSEQAKRSLGAEAEIKSITEQAVVCDLCSSLPSQQPSCVYACPHDAAMRVNAQDFFLSGRR